MFYLQILSKLIITLGKHLYTQCGVLHHVQTTQPKATNPSYPNHSLRPVTVLQWYYNWQRLALSPQHCDPHPTPPPGLSGLSPSDVGSLGQSSSCTGKTQCQLPSSILSRRSTDRPGKRVRLDIKRFVQVNTSFKFASCLLTATGRSFKSSTHTFVRFTFTNISSNGIF